MPKFLVLLFTFFTLTAAPQSDLKRIVDGVDKWFAGMKSFSADFDMTTQILSNQTKRYQGHVYLMPNKKMRWNYEKPQPEQFISDGKKLIHYVQLDRQATTQDLKDGFDDRAFPLMGLIGRADLQKEFKGFVSLKEDPIVAGDAVIGMVPNRKLDIQDIRIEVDPAGYEVRRISYKHTDGLRTDYIFTHIETKTPLSPSLFEFNPPSGVRVFGEGGR